MKAAKQHSALEVIKKEQLKRRVFTVEFKSEVVRHKKAENLSLPECGRKNAVASLTYCPCSSSIGKSNMMRVSRRWRRAAEQ